MNKRLLSLLLVLALMLPALGLAEGLLLPNPTREASREEVLEVTGVNLLVPEKATEVRYTLIEGAGYEPLAQAHFVFQQAEYIWRVQMDDAPNDISGMYHAWQSVTHVEQAPFTGTLCLSESGDGVALWRYEKEGYNFSLAMINVATDEILLELSRLLLPDFGEE